MAEPESDKVYEVCRKGVKIGAFTAVELADLMEKGRVSGSDDVWTEGMEAWAKIEEIRESIDITRKSPERRRLRVAGLTLGYSALACAILTVAYLAFGDGQASPTEGTASATPSTPEGAAVNRENRERLVRVRHRITELVAESFSERVSPAGLSFQHRFLENTGNRTPIRVHVSADGKSWLSTHYQGKQWLLHNQLRFETDSVSFETSVIPAHQASRAIDELNNVTESCIFRDKDDSDLLQRISDICDRNITVQWLGRHPRKLRLSFESKLAFKETQELSKLLVERHSLSGRLHDAN